jgi:hypothetical protein
MATLVPAILLMSTLQAVPSEAAARPTPVLVELFTSEGCSSCPPADATLARLLEEPPVGARVIALGEHVDYWDDLGWKDSFSSPLFSRRQQDYVRRLRLASPYTPQLVAGGRAQALGSDEKAVRSAIAAASRSAAGTIALGVAARSSEEAVLEVRATWSAGQEAEVVVAAVEDRATTRVTRGENQGRTLTHVAVVRSMSVVGAGKGSFSGRVTLAGLQALGSAHAVVFVQERGGGPVYAAESIALDR